MPRSRPGESRVVLVGDFFQLPPVITEDDRAILMKLYPGNFEGWAFESDYWVGSTSSRTS